MLNKIRAEAFPLADRLRLSRNSEDAPPLVQLLSALKPAPMLSERKKNGGLHSLSMTFVRKAACDKGKPSPRPRPKKPKTMPAAKDWMSHQLMRDSNGNIVKCKPEFSEWISNCVSAPNLNNKRFHLKFCHKFRMLAAKVKSI